MIADDSDDSQPPDEDDGEPRISAPRPEEFSRQRHSLLNEELKMLYTALTRARAEALSWDRGTEAIEREYDRARGAR